MKLIVILIHWKGDALKTTHCLKRILVQRHNWAIFLRKWARRGRYTQWRSLSGHVNQIFVHKYGRGGGEGNFSSKMSKERPLQSMAIVIGPCWTYFCSEKLKRMIFATFDFNRTVLRATQPELDSMFYALFSKIALSAAELMLFGHLKAAIRYRWTIICGVNRFATNLRNSLSLLKKKTEQNACSEKMGESSLNRDEIMKLEIFIEGKMLAIQKEVKWLKTELTLLLNIHNCGDTSLISGL